MVIRINLESSDNSFFNDIRYDKIYNFILSIKNHKYGNYRHDVLIALKGYNLSLFIEYDQYQNNKQYDLFWTVYHEDDFADMNFTYGDIISGKINKVLGLCPNYKPKTLVYD
jgi:hypothetical protein